MRVGSCITLVCSADAFRPRIDTAFEPVDLSVGPPRVDLKVFNRDTQPVEVWLEDGKLSPAGLLRGASVKCETELEGQGVAHTLLRTAEFVGFLHKALELTHSKHGPLNMLFHWDPKLFKDGSNMLRWTKFCEGFLDPATHWLQPLPKGVGRKQFPCLPHMPCHGIVKNIFLSEQVNTGVLHFSDDFAKDTRKALDLLKQFVCHPHIHGIDLDDFAHRGGRDPEVEALAIEAELRALASTSTTVTPNDQYYSRQWYMNDTKVNQAWLSVSGQQMRTPKVMVIDSGTNTSHPDLSSNLYTNYKESSGKTGVDDDNNTYVDDIHGIHVSNGKIDGNITDTDGHGSFCIGTIGATTNNTIGVAGMSWGPSLVTCKFMDSGSGLFSDAVKCIDYGVAIGVKVISASWGGATSNYTTMYNAIKSAAGKGVSWVTAAGNAGTNMTATKNYPACWKLNNTLTVSATCQNTTLIDYTNFGTDCVDLAAPGDYIYNVGNVGYQWRGGTSMATPMVAATIVLMLQANSNLDVAQRKSIILSTVQKDSQYKSKIGSSGRLNTYAAVKQALAAAKSSSIGMETTGRRFIVGPGEEMRFPIFIENERSGSSLNLDVAVGSRYKFGEYADPVIEAASTTVEMPC